jgi:hypothetical protein
MPPGIIFFPLCFASQTFLNECRSSCAVSSRERLATFQQSLERSSGIALFIGLGRRQLTLMTALFMLRAPRPPSSLSFSSFSFFGCKAEEERKKEPFYKKEEWLCFKV